MVSLNYRAPELLLGDARAYDWAIDMWSVGLIICELARGAPVISGNDAAKQVRMTFELLGTPEGISPSSDPRSPFMAARARRCLATDHTWTLYPRPDKRIRLLPKESLAILGNWQFLGDTIAPDEARLELMMPDPNMRDLVLSMLSYEPERRPSAEEALRHAYFAATDAGKHARAAAPDEEAARREAKRLSTALGGRRGDIQKTCTFADR